MEVDSTPITTSDVSSAGEVELSLPTPTSGISEETQYTFDRYKDRAFERFLSFKSRKTSCDIKLVAGDKTVFYGHKLVFASASSYFFNKFYTSVANRYKDTVLLPELESKYLKILIEFMYTGKIIIAELDNVMGLFKAAKYLQIHDVLIACIDSLQTRLNLTNCLDIIEFANIHGCAELLSSSKSYIQNHYSELTVTDVFLSLSFEKILDLISSDGLTIPSEEEILESVLRWINHNLYSRKKCIPKLMEHVRLPLLQKEYFLKKVLKERLVTLSLECKDFILEAIRFHICKDQQDLAIPKSIHTKPRQSKIILVFGGNSNKKNSTTEWYDPAINQWHEGHLMSRHRTAGLVVSKDQIVFSVGAGCYNGSLINRYSFKLDLSSSSPYWVPTFATLVARRNLGVALLNDCIYSVGGFDGNCTLDTAEVFDCSTRQLRMISNMSTKRSHVGVGVLDNLLYAVGGYNGQSKKYLKSVESYAPSTDTWVPLAEMSVSRMGAGVGVIDGVLYAVGGQDGSIVLNSVETYKPSVGFWTSVADMHVPRKSAGVVALDGLLYVVGGYDGTSKLHSVEIYNPKTNIWWLVLKSAMKCGRSKAGVVVIDKHPFVNYR